ncbi:VOC family protein [Pseudonocardia sp. GCM10023141]|uniref:VOC family protein n=1 Tax=Pseudonocardia sp. GCM10023141 TaxID=3252653 RepID=UPI00360E56EA
MIESSVPALAGVHHVKLPVSDLARSRAWYESRLGYRLLIEFAERGQVRGLVLGHPRGGPQLALRQDRDRAVAAAGFDYFSIGVPDKEALETLAERLTALGESHAGVHLASIGWILPSLRDPDGHDLRFYTVDHHTDVDPGSEVVVRIDDARETAERRERELPVRG